MSSQKSEHPVPTTSAARSSRRESLDPYAPAAEYYGKSHGPRKVAKSRTYSAHDPHFEAVGGYKAPGRRASADVQGNLPRRYEINIDETLKTLLAREDTDHNIQITVDDHGPKTIPLGTVASGGYKRADVRGTYMLSNLLQELTLAKAYGRKMIVLDEARLNENPVNRMARLIQHQFWPNLTRRIDGSNIAKVAADPKDWTKHPRPRIYVPVGEPDQYKYYQRIAREHPEVELEVHLLREDPSDDKYVRDLNEAPGLLAIEMKRLPDRKDGEPDFEGLPFVVPGGRFNELYGWDSYMETLGLLLNGRADLGKAMVQHFCFCIRHYGKILNANRTYYLCRTQPPLLTDMALRVYQEIKHEPDSKEFLRKAILAAIKDYYNTWTSKPRYDEASGLSCYVPGGFGVPPETEASHFKHLLTPYAQKHNMEYNEFVHAYNYEKIKEPELDEYFLHDRSVRESGHDTSYRLEKVSAHLATVDLNSLLYKYEADIARTIREAFGDRLEMPKEWQVKGQPTVETSSIWDRRARKRKQTMDKLMWDEENGMFFDYNIKLKAQTGYESATTFWAMFAGVASHDQAGKMVKKALPKFEELGGLASGTKKSRGEVGIHRPNRQWDYPFGWAPQQILAWIGLGRYKFDEDAQRLAYRWIHMCTKAFVDYNGVVVEKYDVTKSTGTHKVTAEYGNQGADFKGVATEGFGWVNASYIVGLQIVTAHMKRALGAVTPWDVFERSMRAAEAQDAANTLHSSAANTLSGQHTPPRDASVDHATQVASAKKALGSDVGGHSGEASRHADIPHSREDSIAHQAQHGTSERREHHAPETQAAH